MKVLKFGGTSVGQPDRMRQVADIITADQDSKIVVLSALSGTTNALVNIGELLGRRDFDEARIKIGSLYEHYISFYRALIREDDQQKKALEIVDEHFDFMNGLLEQPSTEITDKELLAQGELLSTRLFCCYLDEAGIKNQLLPALDFMAIDEHDEPDIAYLRSKLQDQLSRYSDHSLFITQGYICLNPRKQIDNLKRGGSDYTASLIGAALLTDLVEIWTDIDGMHNNDPRVVENTRPVAELSFNEASELAYFGAKILHPSSILPARKYNIPVKLRNTMDPGAPGTLIHGEERSSQVKAVAAKDGITAIKIKSTRMLLAYGFLRKIFEIFENYKTPIDMITTSEVAVSLTIDGDKALKEITDELKDFGEVTVDENQSIICIVGNQIAEQKGIVKEIFLALEDIPVRMISYGGSRYNVSVLIDTHYKKEALNALNKGLFGL